MSKAKTQRTRMEAQSDEPIYFNSDKYFNDPDSAKVYEDMGFDVQPVDPFGGFVPQDKSLGNLSKAEQAIRKRFSLGNKGSEYVGK